LIASGATLIDANSRDCIKAAKAILKDRPIKIDSDQLLEREERRK
jgi:hypothetical protein